ncbi:unnamed protein product [Paramecium sonneborni]|uniref:Uncharacterized protein n=1 Tax=Paramecium sonneborni TaxID=65129 RepID=A0A8S1RMK4_9CILI|nr:unnamed protein product [Paramecium sonneborni]
MKPKESEEPYQRDFGKIEKKKHSRSSWISFKESIREFQSKITKSKLDGYSRTSFLASFSPDGNILASEQRQFQTLIDVKIREAY